MPRHQLLDDWFDAEVVMPSSTRRRTSGNDYAA
jgi:hypothetical protein